MARLNYILVLIICLIAFKGRSQTDSLINLTQQKFIPGSFTNFYVDNLDNIYLINTNNQVKKLNSDGDSVAVSNGLKRLGDIYSMDVSNALKLVLYYKDYTTIAVLDRFLKNVNTIDLRKYGILQAKCVATSYDNNYWVFDEVENKLKKIDDNGNLLISTPDLRNVFNELFLPDKMIDYDGNVYLCNKTQGCKIFDYYGALKQTIEPLSWNYIQVIKNSIIGYDDTSLHVYNIPVFTKNSYLLKPVINNAIKLQKSLGGLYVLQNDGLYRYAIN